MLHSRWKYTFVKEDTIEFISRKLSHLKRRYRGGLEGMNDAKNRLPLG